MSNVVYATDSSFDEVVLQSETPVLVDFWAPWCGPCRSIAPILDELSLEYSGRVKVVKVNVDENTSTPGTYEVRGIPTLLLFKNGQLIDRKVGGVSKNQLSAFIDSNI